MISRAATTTGVPPTEVDHEGDSILPTANLIFEGATVDSNVTFGEGNVVHPRCRIMSEGGGPIILGDRNIIEEGVTIVNRSAEALIIGNMNLFSIYSQFEGKSVGNGCILEARAQVAQDCSVGDNCIIGVKCATGPGESIPPSTALYGNPISRRALASSSSVTHNHLHNQHLAYLVEVLPKFLHTRPAA
ncbi:trimeric LpxA-like protein [Phlyctochytrium arcticum]|nr:trimeric LpxA-like protein [Phlyctochytrium arcticum]